jgi:hypothetical protein
MAFTRDDYVVRASWRGVWVVLLGVLGWGALTVGVWLADKRIVTLVALLVFEAVFVGELVRRLRRAIRRKIVFAVSSRGIFFGDGGSQETVPWSRIAAVELFKERVTHSSKSQSTYHCIGVRSLGTKQVQRPGNGRAAQPMPDRAIGWMLNAGRPGLIPGGDGTVRHAYRRMDGWRVSRARLASAVHRYAPEVPLINGPDYPPSLSWQEGMRAKRAKRSFGR